MTRRSHRTIAALLYLVLAVVETWPPTIHLHERIAHDPGDPLLIAYLLNSNARVPLLSDAWSSANRAIQRVSVMPVTSDAVNDVYLLDPASGEWTNLMQMMKECSKDLPPVRIDGQEVVLMDLRETATNEK